MNLEQLAAECFEASNAQNVALSVRSDDADTASAAFPVRPKIFNLPVEQTGQHRNLYKIDTKTTFHAAQQPSEG